MKTCLLAVVFSQSDGCVCLQEKNIQHNGDLTLDDVIEIARVMRDRSCARELSGTCKEILGTCVSVGCTVGDKDPREVQKEVKLTLCLLKVLLWALLPPSKIFAVGSRQTCGQQVLLHLLQCSTVCRMYFMLFLPACLCSILMYCHAWYSSHYFRT